MITPIFTGIVDIHHADGSYNLEAVKAGGVGFLWHKATEGVEGPGSHDSGFPQAMDRAKALGIRRGAYHYGNNVHAPERQAEEFVATVRALTDHRGIVLALDLEGALDNPNTMKTEDAARFIVRVEELTGITPALYAGLSKLGDRCEHASPYVLQVFGRTRLWLAAYGHKYDPRRVTPPPPWSRYWLHQYTNGADGPDDMVLFPRRTLGFAREAQDRSCYRGTSAELAADWDAMGLRA